MPKSQITAKSERKKTIPKSAWKKGQSGNPGGRPKSHQSLSYWLNEFGNMSPGAVADECQVFATELRKGGKALPFFALIAIRALMTLTNETDARLLGEVMDRLEGKVESSLKISGDPNAPLTVKAFDYGTAVAAIAAGPIIDNAAPGADQSNQHGPALGQDDDGG